MNNFKTTKKTICGYQCVENIKSKQLTLFGLYGEIWQYDEFEFRAIIYSSRVAKKYFIQENKPIDQIKDSAYIRLKIDDLFPLIKLLMVPKKSFSQLALASKHKTAHIDGGLEYE